MNWLDKLERKLGRYAIPNLTVYLLAGYVVGFAIMNFMPSLLNWITLEPGLILRGQLWRIISWVLIPPESSNLFFVLIMLYLYYSQMGKCMYSGRPIDIDDLDNVNVYDIDHIYPFSKSNDDSLTNKVLVCSALNREKTNSYPISDSVRSKMAGFWKMLHEKGLINDEKYHRLTRATPFSEDEFENFVARQLVETRQSTKAAAGILRRFFGEETKIVYSKARAVSAFRQKFGFAKCRSVNDLHHAKDAYLNIVAGNILDTKYTSAFCRSADFGNEYYNLSKPFDYNVAGAWIIDKGQSLKTVHSLMAKNNILLTRQPVMKSGALFESWQNLTKDIMRNLLPGQINTADTIRLQQVILL